MIARALLATSSSANVHIYVDLPRPTFLVPRVLVLKVPNGFGVCAYFFTSASRTDQRCSLCSATELQRLAGRPSFFFPMLAGRPSFFFPMHCWLLPLFSEWWCSILTSPLGGWNRYKSISLSLSLLSLFVELHA